MSIFSELVYQLSTILDIYHWVKMIFKGKVIRLIRQQMGPYKLEGLECSQWRSFNSKETNLIDKILSNNKTNSVCHI